MSYGNEHSIHILGNLYDLTECFQRYSTLNLEMTVWGPSNHSPEDCTDVPLRIRLHWALDHEEHPGIGNRILSVSNLRHFCANVQVRRFGKLEDNRFVGNLIPRPFEFRSTCKKRCQIERLTLPCPLQLSSSSPQPQVLHASCHACIVVVGGGGLPADLA